MHAAEVPGSLTDIRVVDLTTNVAGPFATQVLGDLGADVIKVERRTGDDTRGWGPPFWPETGESVSFSTLNRNKRSVVLDLRNADGRRALEELVRSADVLVQNMRPGSFDRLGFPWPRLQELNPSLVYCDLSGFGPEGPRSGEPAYDPLMQAFSGLMSLTGEEGRPPVRIPVSILDKGTGLWAVIAVLDALRTRDRTGRGTHLQLSLLETALSWEPNQLIGHIATGRLPQRLGSAAPGIAPYQAFPTADGYMIVAAGNDRLFLTLCETVGRPDLTSDERFVDNKTRFANRAPLVEELSAVFEREPTSVWLQRLGAAGVPVAPIQTMDEVVADEQVRATGAIERLEHPDGGHDYALVRLPVRVDGQRHELRRMPPKLGEQTDEIMAELSQRRADLSSMAQPTTDGTDA